MSVCTVLYRPSPDAPEVTLTYPPEREDEIMLRAAERFAGKWTREDERRWRELLRDDKKRRGVR